MGCDPTLLNSESTSRSRVSRDSPSDTLSHASLARYVAYCKDVERRLTRKECRLGNRKQMRI